MRMLKASLLSGVGISALVIGSALAAPLQANASTSRPEVNNLLLYPNINYGGTSTALACVKSATYGVSGKVVKS